MSGRVKLARPAPLSWEPRLKRRRGKPDVYCAPACGMGCTAAAHAKAKQCAAALADRLGDGWRPRVWENMGWYHEAISPCGRLKVNGSGRSYSAYLGDADSFGGRWVGDGRTPDAAVRNAVHKGIAELAYIESLLNGLSGLRPIRRLAANQRSAMTSAERQKRYRERRKTLAAGRVDR